MADRNPRILSPFFGPTPVLPPQAMRTLLLVSLGLLAENYDVNLVNAALPQIASELRMEIADTGLYLSAIRLGGIAAFLLIPFADRLGRRRTFLVCLAGMSLATFATAFVATPLQFALCQIVSRAFLLAVATLAVVILAEELPAGQRGGGIALLGIFGGVGFGAGALLYAFVDWLPFGWRALYAVGVLPVFALPFLRRFLKETQRFEQARGAASGPVHAVREHWVAPVAALARNSPRRAAAVGLAGALAALAGISFHQYTSWLVREVHGWTPAQYSLLVLGGGLIGVLGTVVGGRGSDRFGRRRVGFTAWLSMPAFVALFCLGPPETLVVSWGLAVFCRSASEIVLRAVSTELFPTLYRATAGGWLVLVQTVGWSVGLLLSGFFADSDAELPGVIAGLSVASVGAALVLVMFVPETRGHEFDELDAGVGA